MNDAIVEKISGVAVPLRGDNIDTDRIIPARYLRCVTFDGLGEHAFEDDRKQDPGHPFNQERFDGASILIVGRNFGCGSSREHAPQSLHKRGIKGVIGQSFAEIFFGNCNAMGIPCMTVDADTCETLFAAAGADPPPLFEIDVSAGTISFGDRSVQGGMPSGPRKSFLTGTWNATAVLLEAADHTDEVASKLPYITGF
ncbi:MAG: 3-isopropylmalate dehydratase small subunit [Lentisphaeria bacterium]|jgi:3-isopropylmalate/(R)-2-methylmalate dehydratase small subunit|nr:3-isopropylmalate dehydratase small subunit [Lentisphaeria bacterium]MDP7741121.1 3-isopropylmalate dehydratase small subunit [Lentisphaeria bacterium]